jgi:hypothetical protein
VSLPSADDLFRTTKGGTNRTESAEARGGPGKPATRPVHAVPDRPEPESRRQTGRRPSGRVKHDEKMTVYVTADELLLLEHARLSLRSEHGLAVDRGRVVREALHLVLADLEENGETSALVRRLNEA